MTDPIADMLTRIRNANTSKHDTVDVPASKMKVSIADILFKEGYIQKYELVYTQARMSYLEFSADLVSQSFQQIRA